MLGPEMKLPAAILCTVIACSPAAFAAPRIAVVRVADIYKSLEKTRQQQEAIAADFDALYKDRRLTELRRLLTTLKSQSSTLPQQVDDASRAKVREYALKYREAETLQEDYASFREEETRKINTKKVKEMRQSLDLIVETARKIGKDEGFDWVLDTSGNTNTTTPLILYAKGPVDLTDRVLTTLQPNAAGDKAPTNDKR
jgi:Skp family chaperone for outer membrane proteins